MKKSPKLLSVAADAKTVKGQKMGYLTGVLYLAPHTISGYQVCPKASEGCRLACLYTAGRGIYNKTQQSRIAKTKLFFQKRDEFMELFREEISTFVSNLRTKVGMWYQAGVGIFKDLTDCNDLERALKLTNSFKKQGVGLTIQKVSRGGQEAFEYTVTSEFGNHKFTTLDSEEVMVFLGSLARTFTTAMQSPDPKWFNNVAKIGAKEMPF